MEPPAPDDHGLATARRDGVAIGVAVGVVGVAFGVLARAAGLSVAKACAMSLLVFTGASQFAAVGAVTAGGTGLAALGSALLLAARNALYGPVVQPWFARDSVARRAVVAQVIIDESAGVGAAQPDVETRRRGFLAAGIGVYVCWNVGTLLGALGGQFVGSVETWGLDAAFPAAFVALIVAQIRTRSGQLAALTGAAITIVAVPLLPVGVPILLAALGAIPAALHSRSVSRGSAS